MAAPTVTRLVGIDFGTSTSLIRVKRYQGSTPLGDSYTTGAVTYGHGAADSTAVTLVRKNPDGSFSCGRYGEEDILDCTVYREFKMDLENPDPEKQRLAKELTKVFFRYLYERYAHQESDLGQFTDQRRTLVSYPAKWKQETRTFMEQAATEAGFSNVSSMDEPSAALYAVLCRKMDDIIRQGLLRAGQSGYVLLIDMGAGTTDLAVCRYAISEAAGTLVAADRIRTEIVSTWPEDSSSLTFGGREVDQILEDYLVEYLKSNGIPQSIADKAIRGKPSVKSWKEDTVSNLLGQNKAVEHCSFATLFAALSGDKPFPAFGREKFRQMLESKLEDFRQLVTGCLDDAVQKEPELAKKGIDLVVLTGGHSSWYFTEEMLNGTMPGISHSTLKKVQQEKHRVLRLTNPQETVALGMVYSRLPFQVETTPAYTLTVCYIDENGKALCPPRIRSGIKEGSTYDSFQREFPDYTFRRIIGGEPSGTMTDDKTITYVYAKSESLPPLTLRKFITSYPFLGQPLTAKNCNTFAYVRMDYPQAKQNLIYCGLHRSLSNPDPDSLDHGTLFTSEGIYTKYNSGSASFCPWEIIPNSFLFMGGCNQFQAHDIRSGKEYDIGYVDEQHRSSMFRFYQELQAFLRKSQGISGFSWLHKDYSHRDFSKINFEQILKQTLLTCPGDTVQELTAKAVPTTLRRHLQISADETIYFAHDSTWFHTGKNGTVMTDKGVHTSDWTILGRTGPYFTNWEQFAKGTFRADYSTLSTSTGKSSCAIVGNFVGSDFTRALQLYLLLLKNFREAADCS